MANEPLTLAVFEEFERKLFAHLDRLDHRFEALEQAMNSRFGEITHRLSALLRRPLPFDTDDDM